VREWKLVIESRKCGCVWLIYPDRFPDTPSTIFKIRDCGAFAHYEDLDPVIYRREIDIPTLEEMEED